MPRRHTASVPTRHHLAGALGRIITVFTLLLMFCLSQPAIVSSAQDETVGPAIRVDVGSRGNTYNITVIGHGFTAGGMVFISVYGQEGMVVPGTLVVASHPVLQPPSYLEPGAGFSFDTGGNVREEFQVPVPDDAQRPARKQDMSAGSSMDGMECASSFLVRAYDQTTDIWSHPIEVNLGC